MRVVTAAPCRATASKRGARAVQSSTTRPAHPPSSPTAALKIPQTRGRSVPASYYATSTTCTGRWPGVLIGANGQLARHGERPRHQMSLTAPAPALGRRRCAPLTKIGCPAKRRCTSKAPLKSRLPTRSSRREAAQTLGASRQCRDNHGSAPRSQRHCVQIGFNEARNTGHAVARLTTTTGRLAHGWACARHEPCNTHSHRRPESSEAKRNRRDARSSNIITPPLASQPAQLQTGFARFACSGAHASYPLPQAERHAPSTPSPHWNAGSAWPALQLSGRRPPAWLRAGVAVVCSGFAPARRRPAGGGPSAAHAFTKPKRAACSARQLPGGGGCSGE